MNRDLVKQTETFLCRMFEESEYLSAHPEARAYRLEHSYRVANIGRKIAAAEGFNETEMVIACLLHDISYCKEFHENGWKDHGREAARIARPFLEKLGLPEARIQDICYGIAIHVDDEADFAGERTPFALSVGDADNIDRVDAYRIHETLVMNEFLNLSYEEKVDQLEKRLENLRNLMDMPMGTRTAEQIWKDRIAYYIGFCEKLLAQLQNSTAIIDERN